MKKKILIVEDDKDVQECYEIVLQDLETEAELFWAGNGQEALELIDSGEEIDLIILDIVMPVMSGVELLRELLHVRKLDIPVIISSVYKDMASRLHEVAKVQGMFYKLDKMDDFLVMVKDSLAS